MWYLLVHLLKVSPFFTLMRLTCTHPPNDKKMYTTRDALLSKLHVSIGKHSLNVTAPLQTITNHSYLPVKMSLDGFSAFLWQMDNSPCILGLALALFISL